MSREVDPASGIDFNPSAPGTLNYAIAHRLDSTGDMLSGLGHIDEASRMWALSTQYRTKAANEKMEAHGHGSVGS